MSPVGRERRGQPARPRCPGRSELAGEALRIDTRPAQPEHAAISTPSTDTPHPSALQLFLVFSRIGLSSFGGGLSGWLHREFVIERRWLGEEEFLNGLALSQALPGVNVSNMAIWIGYRMLGTWGAFASLAGIVVPAAVAIVLLATVLAALTRFELTHLALDGAAAAAIGLSLSMGITTARRVPRKLRPLAVMVATFAAVGLLHWPLFEVVLIGGTASVAAEYARLLRA